MIAAFMLLLALQITPALRQHVEAGLKAKASGDLDTAAQLLPEERDYPSTDALTARLRS